MKDDYYVYFRGAGLTKRQANMVGLGILFGVLGTAVVVFFPISGKAVAYAIITLFALAGGILGILIWRK
jgi:hypothetical protein